MNSISDHGTRTSKSKVDVGRIHYWIDQACEFNENNGIQRVCRYLARGLEGFGQQLAFRRWSDRKQRPTFCTRRQLQKFARWNGPRLDSRSAPAGPAWWLEQVHAPQPGEWFLVPEVTYGRTTEHGGHETRATDLASTLIDDAHSGGLKIAFLFYDLLPLTMHGDPLRQLHEQYIKSIARADLILPISYYAAESLTRHYSETLGIPLDSLPPIVTCPLADEYLGWPRVTEVREVPADPIEILCVATISPRKNQLRLLQAFDAFCREHPSVDVHLSLVGNFYRPASEEIERAVEANPRTTLVGFLGDHEVIQRYRRAHFSVFPSIGEGYGLPIVESLWLGKPCLCANFGSMAELAAGGGCLTVDTRSVSELKDGLARLILHHALRARLTREAMARPMRAWQEYASSILRALQQTQR